MLIEWENLDKETVIIINSMNQNAKGYELMMKGERDELKVAVVVDVGC